MGQRGYLKGYNISSTNNFSLPDEESLINIYKVLNDKGVILILVSTPFYWDCLENANEYQKEYLKGFALKFCKNHKGCFYQDYSSDLRFEYDDFYDEAHVSCTGARKLTNGLNDLIDSLLYK